MIRSSVFRKSLRLWCALSVTTLALPFAARLWFRPHCGVPRYQVIELPPLAGQAESGAAALNDRREVVGWSGLERREKHAILWRPGSPAKPVDLGTLGGHFTDAIAINDAGQVVGWSTAAGKTSREPAAFLWQRDRMVDLNSLIAPGSGWVLRKATAINNRGEIAGMGLHYGRLRGFLLLPESE